MPTESTCVALICTKRPSGAVPSWTGADTVNSLMPYVSAASTSPILLIVCPSDVYLSASMGVDVLEELAERHGVLAVYGHAQNFHNDLIIDLRNLCVHGVSVIDYISSLFYSVLALFFVCVSLLNGAKKTHGLFR